MVPGSFLLDMLNRSKEQGELVAETETRSAVFVARRPSVRARMASCPFDDPPSWWMVKKCVPDQKIVTRWEGDGARCRCRSKCSHFWRCFFACENCYAKAVHFQPARSCSSWAHESLLCWNCVRNSINKSPFYRPILKLINIQFHWNLTLE